MAAISAPVCSVGFRSRAYYGFPPCSEGGGVSADNRNRISHLYELEIFISVVEDPL